MELSELLVLPPAGVAAVLRAKVQADGRSRAGLAQATGASRQAVYSWLTTGRVAKIHLPAICRYLGIAP